MLSKYQNEIKDYYSNEINFKKNLPRSIIEAYNLEHFEFKGQPHKIESIDELWKFHDCMGVPHYKRWLAKIKTDILVEDFETLKKTALQIFEFGKKIQVTNAGKHDLSQSFLHLTYLRERVENFKNLKVLEIGPGPGYFAALLINSGIEYSCVEASQGMYLYQKIFWKETFKNKYNDIIQNKDNGLINHIPWYKFVQENFELPEFDIVIMNNVIAEMHENAIKFTLQKIKDRSLKSSKDIDIISHGFGASDTKNLDKLVHNINKIGWEIVELTEEFNITFSLRNSKKFNNLNKKNFKINYKMFFKEFIASIVQFKILVQKKLINVMKVKFGLMQNTFFLYVIYTSNKKFNYLKNKKTINNKQIKNFFKTDIFSHISKDENFFTYIDKK